MHYYLEHNKSLKHNRRLSQSPEFEWSGYKLSTAQPFEYWTIWIPTFKIFGFQMFPVLEGSDFGSSMYSSLQVYENKLNAVMVNTKF